MRIRLVAISMQIIVGLAATLDPAPAQTQAGEPQIQKLYPRADEDRRTLHGFASKSQRRLDLNEWLNRIDCAGSGLCAWRRIPAPGEQFWRGRHRQAPR
jgi:hypothetical protein